jgi:transposase
MERETRGNVSYVGKEVFVGIDVHRKKYAVTVVSEGAVVFRYMIAGRPELLISSLLRRYQGAKIKSAYEAGFSGFVLHRELERAGIENIVVNAASIEVNARDRVKTDKRDSQKIAVQLSKGSLTGIRIPSEKEEQARLLTRTREQLVSHRTSHMNEIRMKLHQFGLLPIDYAKKLSLKDVERWIAAPSFPALVKVAIELLVGCWRQINEQLKVVRAKLTEQAGEDPNEAVYRSVPGIGPLGARVLSNELGDMSQFKNERQLFSFSGMTPMEFSTGDKKHRGHISRQGSPRLRKTLTEAAWVAIRYDSALSAVYGRIAKKSGGKRAIIAVARRLLGRIRHLFMTKELYELDVRETKQKREVASIAA